MLQTIYRIEHLATKVGPFQTDTEYTQSLAKKAAATQHLKSPGDDGLPLGHLPFSFVFGCPDIQSLKQWFFLGVTAEENERIVRTLKDMGFVLVEYLADSYDYELSRSGNQIAFDARNCVEEGLVQVHDIGILLDEFPAARSVH